MNENTVVPGSGDKRFDVRMFARTVAGSHRGEIDLGPFATAPLAAEPLRLLCLLRDFEASTMQHLRNVLVTATHKDARVTAFLVSWAYEKYWIADALDAVVEANGPAAHDTAPAAGHAGKRRHTFAEVADRHGPVWRAISAIRKGTAIIAVHMTAGVVDGLVTGAGYEALLELADSAPLATVVDRVLHVKARHAEFFTSEAAVRLAHSGSAVRLTARSLGRTAWPLGALTRSAADRAFFERITFGTERGALRADGIARIVEALPGITRRDSGVLRARIAP